MARTLRDPLVGLEAVVTFAPQGQTDGRRHRDRLELTRSAARLQERDGVVLKAVAENDEGNGGVVIRGAGCPLAALTGKHRGVCLAIESLVSEIVGVVARECCDRNARLRCCFEIDTGHRRRSTWLNADRSGNKV